MALFAILVGLVFFAALVALLGTSYYDRTRATEDGSLHHPLHATAAEDDECILCHASLPRCGTADEAVSAIERRIAADRSEVADGLGGGLTHALAERAR